MRTRSRSLTAVVVVAVVLLLAAVQEAGALEDRSTRRHRHRHRAYGVTGTSSPESVSAKNPSDDQAASNVAAGPISNDEGQQQSANPQDSVTGVLPDNKSPTLGGDASEGGDSPGDAPQDGNGSGGDQAEESKVSEKGTKDSPISKESTTRSGRSEAQDGEGDGADAQTSENDSSDDSSDDSSSSSSSSSDDGDSDNGDGDSSNSDSDSDDHDSDTPSDADSDSAGSTSDGAIKDNSDAEDSNDSSGYQNKDRSAEHGVSSGPFQFHVLTSPDLDDDGEGGPRSLDQDPLGLGTLMKSMIEGGGDGDGVDESSPDEEQAAAREDAPARMYRRIPPRFLRHHRRHMVRRSPFNRRDLRPIHSRHRREEHEIGERHRYSGGDEEQDEPVSRSNDDDTHDSHEEDDAAKSAAAPDCVDYVPMVCDIITNPAHCASRKLFLLPQQIAALPDAVRHEDGGPMYEAVNVCRNTCHTCNDVSLSDGTSSQSSGLASDTPSPSGSGRTSWWGQLSATAWDTDRVILEHRSIFMIMAGLFSLVLCTCLVVFCCCCTNVCFRSRHSEFNRISKGSRGKPYRKSRPRPPNPDF